jgi:hypothetical protein
MKSSQKRRMSHAERVLASYGRTHYLWQETDETDEAVTVRKRAMIASGEASANDRFVIFQWTSDDKC